MYKTIHQYYVYILSNQKNGVLYIGMTNNLERRMFEHKNKLVDGFTEKYKLSKLVYFEMYPQVKDAILREKRLKKWKRQWKINLIEEENSNWTDLAFDWFEGDSCLRRNDKFMFTISCIETQTDIVSAIECQTFERFVKRNTFHFF